MFSVRNGCLMTHGVQPRVPPKYVLVERGVTTSVTTSSNALLLAFVLVFLRILSKLDERAAFHCILIKLLFHCVAASVYRDLRVHAVSERMRTIP